MAGCGATGDDRGMAGPKVIGIVGGTGRMGQLFAGILERRGHRVLIASRSTALTPEAMVPQCDVVVITVPIAVTEQVIRQVGPLVRKDALLMDLTSLKEFPLNAMLQRCTGSVVGTHPVFGPSVQSFQGQTFVVCPGRGDAWHKWVLDFLCSEGAVIKETDAATHDRHMAIIQGMQHFSTIGLGMALRRLGMKPEALLEYSSPIYRIRLDMVGRILGQDPELYADIELQNRHNAESIGAYVAALRELQNVLATPDRDGFLRFFQEAAAHAGDFCSQAMDETDRLIRTVADSVAKAPAALPTVGLGLLDEHTIITLGPEGTFSHQAALAADAAARVLFVSHVAEVFSTLEVNTLETGGTEGALDAREEQTRAQSPADISPCSFIRGVVPVENTLSGSEGLVLDLLGTGHVDILEEITIPINHMLAVKSGMRPAEIERVFAHPSAYMQCRQFLQRTYPSAKIIYCSSNAETARQCGPRSAAVTTALAAAQHGLSILHRNIQDVKGNVTRFLVIAPKGAKASGLLSDTAQTGELRKGSLDGAAQHARYKTSALLVPTSDRPGLLYDLLGAFRDVNLTRLESRPNRARLGTYVFYVDCEGIVAGALAEALRTAEQHCQVTVLGTYPCRQIGAEGLRL